MYTETSMRPLSQFSIKLEGSLHYEEEDQWHRVQDPERESAQIKAHTIRLNIIVEKNYQFETNRFENRKCNVLMSINYEVP